MSIPKAFYKFCGYLFQDIGIDNPDQSEWIVFAAQHLDASEKGDLKGFLVELIDSSITDSVLQKIWFESSAEIYFPEADDLRGFLRMVRDKIV